MTGAVRVFICLMLAAPVGATAQIILCTDDRGRTYTADRLIPECQGRAMKNYGKSATVVREIPAPPTAEQLRQQQLVAEKKREQENVRKERQRQDEALMAAYRSEDDIVAARERAAAPIYEMIRYEKMARNKAHERRSQAQMSWSRAQERDDSSAGEWQRRAEAAEGSVRTSESRLHEYEEELVKLRSDYDARLKRYRALKNEKTSLAGQ